MRVGGGAEDRRVGEGQSYDSLGFLAPAAAARLCLPVSLRGSKEPLRSPGRGSVLWKSSSSPFSRPPVCPLQAVTMLALISRLLDWFRSLFWKEEMELTLVGLQYSGKTTFVNVIAVSTRHLPASVSQPTNRRGVSLKAGLRPWRSALRARGG